MKNLQIVAQQKLPNKAAYKKPSEEEIQMDMERILNKQFNKKRLFKISSIRKMALNTK